MPIVCRDGIFFLSHSKCKVAWYWNKLHGMSNGIRDGKNLSWLATLLDIYTKSLTLFSPTSPPSNESTSTPLTPLFAELGYVCIVFIPRLACTASSKDQLGIDNIGTWAKFVGTGARGESLIDWWRRWQRTPRCWFDTNIENICETERMFTRLP